MSNSHNDHSGESRGEKQEKTETRQKPSLEDTPDINSARHADHKMLKIAHSANDNIWLSEEGIFAITENGKSIVQPQKSYGLIEAAEARTTKYNKSLLDHNPGTFDAPNRGKVTKLADGTVLDWPKPDVEYHLGSETFKSDWQPGQPLDLLNPDKAVGTVINWVNTFSAANPGVLNHDTGNALRHVLCPAVIMSQLRIGGLLTAYGIDLANLGFEGWSAVEAAWPALSKGNIDAAKKIIDWEDTDKDLHNATAGVNIGISNLFTSSDDITTKVLEAAFATGKNKGKVPNINRWF